MMRKHFLVKIKKAIALTLAAGMIFTSYTPAAKAAEFDQDKSVDLQVLKGDTSNVKVTFKGPREGYASQGTGSVIVDPQDGGIGTANLYENDTHRLYFDFADGTNYTYTPGDLVSVRYSSYLDLSKDEAIIAWSDGTPGHINLGEPKTVSPKGYMTYEFPQDTEGKFTTNQPQYFRLKGPNGTVAKIEFGGVEIHAAGTAPSFADLDPIELPPTEAPPTFDPNLKPVVGVPASDSTAGNTGSWTVSEAMTGGIATYTCVTAGSTCRIQVPVSDYTYRPGDLLSIRTDDFDPVGQEICIGYSLSSGSHVYIKNPVSYHVGYITFQLPTDPSDVFKTMNPTLVRIKLQNLSDKQVGDTIHLKGLEIHQTGTLPSWDNGTIREIFPEAKATGLAVTYYNDIYSRGFAWCTDEHCTEGYVYIIKKTGDMTVDNIDWSQAQVFDASAGMVTRTEVNSKDTTLDGKKWHYFKTHITNLEPGATYFFKAGNEFDGFTEVGTIEVEKAADEIDSLTFIHTTDSQEESVAGFDRWAKVLRESYEKYPDSKFVAFTGDMSNDTHGSWGTVGGNMMLSQWNWGLQQPADVLVNTVILASSGNHDAGDYAFYDRFEYDYVDYKKNSDEDIKTGGVYSYEYGNNIFFINLDTNISPWGTASDDAWVLQKKWLESELEAHKDWEWKIVQLHKGLMSTGDHTNDDDVDKFREQLPPIFAKYGVDLVLQGHDHVYTRSATYQIGEGATGFNVSTVAPVVTQNYSFDGETRLWNEEPEGTHYVTINYSANKAYPPRPNDTHPEPLDEVIELGTNPIAGNGTTVQPNLPMYGVVRIRGDVLCYDAYTYNRDTDVSTLYDTFAIVKDPNAQPTATPTGAPSEVPTGAPSEVPTGAPSEVPTGAPSEAPTEDPGMRWQDRVINPENFYTMEEDEDSNIVIKYTKDDPSGESWYDIRVDVSDYDKDKYERIEMDVIAGRKLMNVGITNTADSNSVYRNHWSF